MPDQELTQMEKRAVDLNQSRAAREAADAARLASAQRAAESQVKKWDRAMTRAFKGIVGRSERRRRMDRAVSRLG